MRSICRTRAGWRRAGCARSCAIRRAESRRPTQDRDAARFFEKSCRCGRGQHKRARSDEIRMIQREAAAQVRVAEPVREEQPRRTRRKNPEALGRMLLKGLIPLQKVMEIQHERIVNRASTARRIE